MESLVLFEGEWSEHGYRPQLKDVPCRGWGNWKVEDSLPQRVTVLPVIMRWAIRLKPAMDDMNITRL